MALNFKTNQIITCGLLFITKIILTGIAVFKMNWGAHGYMPYMFLSLLLIYNWNLFANKLFKKEFNKNSSRKINVTVNAILLTCHLFTFWQVHHNLPVEELIISAIVVTIDIVLTENILKCVIDMDDGDITEGKRDKEPVNHNSGITIPKEL